MHESDRKKLIEQRRFWYKSLVKIYCPALMSDILFNAKGFYHLLYDGTGAARSVEERKRRLALVTHVPGIIEGAKKVSWKRLVMKNTYWVLKEKSIIVVIRKTGNGNYFYHSVMDEKAPQNQKDPPTGEAF